MKKLNSLLVGVALIVGTGTALAAPLATYTHNYGRQAGGFDPGGNDVLSNGYVTVSDQSSSRFSDSFSFSTLSYDSIDHFDLSLTYSDTNANFLGWPLELWFARPGGTPDQYTSFKLNAVGGQTIQTFTVDSSLVPEFAQMVAAKDFYFWFSEDTSAGQNNSADTFKLYSASLTVDGQATVPEPASLALLGLGLAGLGFARRRKQKAA